MIREFLITACKTVKSLLTLLGTITGGLFICALFQPNERHYDQRDIAAVKFYTGQAKNCPVEIKSTFADKRSHELRITFVNKTDKVVDSLNFGYCLIDDAGKDVSQSERVADWNYWPVTIAAQDSFSTSLFLKNSWATGVKDAFVADVVYRDRTEWHAVGAGGE